MTVETVDRRSAPQKPKRRSIFTRLTPIGVTREGLLRYSAEAYLRELSRYEDEQMYQKKRDDGKAERQLPNFNHQGRVLRGKSG